MIDVVAVAPNSADWDVDVTIDGGASASGDKVVVETPGTAVDTHYQPTGGNAGNLTLVESSPVTATHLAMLNDENLVYDGGSVDRDCHGFVCYYAA